MPAYLQLGNVPRKRHTVFRRPNGELYHEHVMGSRGFSGPESVLYHLRAPTSIKSSRLLKKLEWQADPDPTLRMRHFRLSKLTTAGASVLDRVPVLFNRDAALAFEILRSTDDFFYRNAEGDELAYISEGR